LGGKKKTKPGKKLVGSSKNERNMHGLLNQGIQNNECISQGGEEKQRAVSYASVRRRIVVTEEKGKPCYMNRSEKRCRGIFPTRGTTI